MRRALAMTPIAAPAASYSTSIGVAPRLGTKLWCHSSVAAYPVATIHAAHIALRRSGIGAPKWMALASRNPRSAYSLTCPALRIVKSTRSTASGDICAATDGKYRRKRDATTGRVFAEEPRSVEAKKITDIQRIGGAT